MLEIQHSFDRHLPLDCRHHLGLFEFGDGWILRANLGFERSFVEKGTVRLFPSDFALPQTLPGHASLITHLVCTANGKWCATIAEQDRFVNIWNLDCSSTSITQLAAASGFSIGDFT